MCVHLCFSLKQTLTACRTAWPCWHFIFHLASSINHSTRIQYNACGHPSLLALIIPLRRKLYSQRETEAEKEQGEGLSYTTALTVHEQYNERSIQRFSDDLDCGE